MMPHPKQANALDRSKFLKSNIVNLLSKVFVGTETSIDHGRIRSIKNINPNLSIITLELIDAVPKIPDLDLRILKESFDNMTCEITTELPFYGTIGQGYIGRIVNIYNTIKTHHSKEREQKVLGSDFGFISLFEYSKTEKILKDYQQKEKYPQTTS